MRFLLDQDVYAITARFLRALTHDVVTAAEIGLSQATDAVLLRRAQEHRRLLVTRDRDLGALVFVEHAGMGVSICVCCLEPWMYAIRSLRRCCARIPKKNSGMPSMWSNQDGTDSEGCRRNSLGDSIIVPHGRLVQAYAVLPPAQS
jgi:uncharacterized protein DUF5615